MSNRSFSETRVARLRALAKDQPVAILNLFYSQRSRRVR